MTTPAEAGTTEYDLGNLLLAGGPAKLTGSIADTAEGPRFMLTIRTASTTLTVFLDRNEALSWGHGITELARTMNGLVVPAGLLAKKPRPR